MESSYIHVGLGIPYGTVNLKKGVPPGETVEASVAGAGSLTLEFSVLSALTGDGRFAEVSGVEFLQA